MSLAKKRIVFLRHGRSYMNDFIGGVNFGAPDFSDIFPDTPENRARYIDSPLTPAGIEQAKTLNSALQRARRAKSNSAYSTTKDIVYGTLLDEIDLVIVSPLTRTLETLDIGLYPLIKARNVPIIASPLASERLYLVSDIGKPRNELKKSFEYVDFDSCIRTDKPWHFEPTDSLKQTYIEWRPSGEGQQYACLGEPQDYFDGRMSELYQFLDERLEKTIVVVCHAGVIDWFLNESFENCELRIVNFDDLTIQL